MTEPIDSTEASFRRSFRPRVIDNVCVLSFDDGVDPTDSGVLALLSAGVDSMVAAGVRGFVLGLTRFSRHSAQEENLGHVVRLMQPVLRSGCPVNWLHGSPLVEEWKRQKLLGVAPHNFETEREAVEALQTTLKAARVRPDLAGRILNSGVSFKQIADAAGLFEGDVRRIAEGLQEPSDRIALLISSTLESLSLR